MGFANHKTYRVRIIQNGRKENNTIIDIETIFCRFVKTKTSYFASLFLSDRTKQSVSPWTKNYKQNFPQETESDSVHSKYLLYIFDKIWAKIGLNWLKGALPFIEFCTLFFLHFFAYRRGRNDQFTTGTASAMHSPKPNGTEKRSSKWTSLVKRGPEVLNQGFMINSYDTISVYMPLLYE